MTTWNEFMFLLEEHLSDNEPVNFVCKDFSDNQHQELFLDGNAIAANFVCGYQFAILELEEGYGVLTKEDLIKKLKSAFRDGDCQDAEVAIKWKFMWEKNGFFGVKREPRHLLADKADAYLAEGLNNTIVFSAKYFMSHGSIVPMMSSM